MRLSMKNYGINTIKNREGLVEDQFNFKFLHLSDKISIYKEHKLKASVLHNQSPREESILTKMAMHNPYKCEYANF